MTRVLVVAFIIGALLTHMAVPDTNSYAGLIVGLPVGFVAGFIFAYMGGSR